MEPERKTLSLELKAEEEGSFSAVFATFNVIDHDGDVTVPGAFRNAASVVIGSYGHNTRELPIGKGTIRADQKEAAVDGRFFLDVPHAKESYETIKAIGDMQEWSYIFMPAKVSFGEFENRQVRFLEEIDVFSVDPVLAGAGIDTRTTAIKSNERRTFIEAAEAILAEIEEFDERLKSRAEFRAKEGRTLSAANIERLGKIATALEASAGELKTMLEDANPKASPSEELVVLRLQYLKGQSESLRTQMSVA